MNSFKIDIAGFCIRCEVNYEYSYKLCRDYLTDKDEEMSVRITADDIKAETKRNDECGQYPHSEAFIESLALYRKICTELALRETVLIHGSSLMADGGAVLFCAPSGTGKSTHTRLWRQVYGDKVVMINDDKPLVRIVDGMPVIYGTPWNGKHRLGTNMSAPLKNICFLQRGEQNVMTEGDRAKALPTLLRYTFRPDDPMETMAMLGTAEKIAETVRFWDLACNMDPEAAEQVRDAVGQAVAYSRANVGDSHGLSVYHPYRNHEKYLEKWKTR